MLSFVVAFGAGIVSFLAPCTVPLLPAYVGVLAAAPVGLLRGALLYVAGFTTVFVAIGLGAGALDVPQPVGGVVVLLMAVLLLLGRGGGSLRGRLLARVSGSSSAAMPFVLGLVSGTAFTPCVGPFLGAVLTLGAVEGSSLRGGALLAAYGLGLGVPFVLASLGVEASPRLARTLNRLARPISLVGAVLLVLLGVALLTGEYDRVAGWFVRVLPFPTV